MYINDFYEICTQKSGVTEAFPFDEDTLVFKVGNKMFALSSLSEWENGNPSVNLKCDPDRAQELRAAYDGILPGYHMNKKHWNTIQINKDVPYTILLEMIDHSYHLVFSSLPKKIQNEILGKEDQ